MIRRHRPSHRVRVAALAAAMAVAAVMAPAIASAYDLVVVQPFQNDVYTKIIDGYKDTCGGQVTTFTLNSSRQLDPRDLATIKATRPAAILAIGPAALTEILSRKPPMPVLFTAITEKPPGSGPAGGVLMAIPLDRQLDTLLKLAPQVKSVGVIYNPARTQFFVDDLNRAAKARNVAVSAIVSTSPTDAVKNIATLFPTVDAYILAPDLTVHSDTLEKAAGQLSAKLKKPVVGFKGTQLGNGILFATELDPEEMGKQVGDVTHEIVSGKKPSNSFAPVKNFKLIVNSKVAAALGLTVPAQIQANATIYGEDQ